MSRNEGILRIVVTGGAGFIGSAVVRQLLRETTYSILNIDALTYAAAPESLDEVKAHPRYHFARVDICDTDALAAAWDDFDPDGVIHLAAETHVDRSIDEPGDFLRTNVIGTVNLLRLAQRHWKSLGDGRDETFRFHHVSTDEVFGTLGDTGVFDESSPYDPHSPYAASKAASDHFVRAWADTYGLPVLISNTSNNYGPWQFPEKLIPLTIIKALRNEEIRVYGNGSNIRDWLYVEDHARALAKVFQSGRPGSTYLLGARAEQTNLDVVQRICCLLDRLRPRPQMRYADLICFVRDRPGHDFRYAIDPTRAQREFGWTPAETFESGLEKTVRWYLEHESWWQRISEVALLRRGELPSG